MLFIRLVMTVLMGLFMQLNNLTSIWFLALFLSIIVTGVLELRWSGVSIEDWWRNEQFWVIGGVSAHLFAVFQGLLKVLAGVDTNFTVTAKAANDAEFGEALSLQMDYPSDSTDHIDNPQHGRRGGRSS